MTPHDNFLKCLRTAGYGPFTYSGRYMFGKECVAVAADNVAALFVIGIHIGRWGEKELLDDKEYKNVKIDDLGKGIVIYWPDIPI